MTQYDLSTNLQKARDITERLKREIQHAVGAWAHFEAINGATEGSRENFRTALCEQGFGSDRKILLTCLLESTIVRLCRITDNPGRDRWSLCRLSEILDDPDVVKNRTICSTYDVEALLAKSHAADCKQRIKKFKSLVPSKWSNKKPSVPSLWQWRNDFRPYRDHAGAHIIDKPFEKASINRVRDGIRLITDLVHDAEIIFLEKSCTYRLPELFQNNANKFWDIAQTGFTRELSGKDYVATTRESS